MSTVVATLRGPIAAVVSGVREVSRLRHVDDTLHALDARVTPRTEGPAIEPTAHPQ